MDIMGRYFVDLISKSGTRGMMAASMAGATRHGHPVLAVAEMGRNMLSKVDLQYLAPVLMGKLIKNIN